MTLVTSEPEVAKLLESSKYSFVAGFGDNTFEAITNKLIQIETYDLHDEELTAILFGKFKPYEASIGAITGFYVNAYDDPSGMGTDLLYSFKHLDDAMDLIKELQAKVNAYYSKI